MSLQEKASHSVTGIPRVQAETTQRTLRDLRHHILHHARDVLVLIDIWWRTARERRALARLDDRLLQDIGLTREQAEQEVMRPFWDV